ncbi:MAG: DUF1611 domain-containing protein [Gammaproteobacteria bacterium]|nr:MAG: DUF1611 domain-containing protein [Gammaproteobacteria bacterium]
MRMSIFCASVTRISDLERLDFGLRELPLEQWQDGDYVVCRVTVPPGGLRAVELSSGRLAQAMDGDVVVGALGRRAATLEVVGDWRASDGVRLDLMTPAGLIGRITSQSRFLQPLIQLEYLGHASRGEERLGMGQFVADLDQKEFQLPVVLIVGTSMSAGKTTTARIVTNRLKAAGRRVVAAKFTGAARYRDILSMRDAGAERVCDFVDAGLPSTVCPAEVFRSAVGQMLAILAAHPADVAVIEAGASPLEPYNGALAMELLAPWIRVEILCASDPYAVAGVVQAFERRPDLVAGGAANTSAGIGLVQRLTGLEALDLSDPASYEALDRMLRDLLGTP